MPFSLPSPTVDKLSVPSVTAAVEELPPTNPTNQSSDRLGISNGLELWDTRSNVCVDYFGIGVPAYRPTLDPTLLVSQLLLRRQLEQHRLFLGNSRRVRWDNEELIAAPGVGPNMSTEKPQQSHPVHAAASEELRRKVTADSIKDIKDTDRNNIIKDSNTNTNHNINPIKETGDQEVTTTDMSRPRRSTSDESVVPNLMAVYDALTQSSTPQLAVPFRHSSHPDSRGKQLLPPPPLPDMDDDATNRRSSARSRSVRSGSVDDSVHSDRSTAGSKRKGAPQDKHEKHLRMTVSRKKSPPPARTDPTDRKKITPNANDPRWSKRFTWPDELHRSFVAAIFDVGLKHSSPSAIMEHMSSNPDVTSERVKSHLQKYRLNRQKSRSEFLSSYDSALDGFRKRGHDGSLEDPNDADAGFSCGELAALCTHSILTEFKHDDTQTQQASSHAPADQPEEADGVSTLHLPLLTAEERDSPLGQSFGYLVGMFQTLSMQLESNRRRTEKIDPPLPDRAFPSTTLPHPYSFQTPLERAATAASLHNPDPGIHDVANSIPHAVRMIPNPAQFPPYSGFDPRQPPYFGTNRPFPTPYPYARPAAVPCPLEARRVIHPTAGTSPGNNTTGRTLQAQKESNHMKQEMKNQKKFQNKMRELKQVEMSKYGGRKGREEGQYREYSEQSPMGNEEGLDQVFWPTGEVHDQLFDFLMES